MSGPVNLENLLKHHTTILQGVQDQLSSSPNEEFYNLENSDVQHPETGQTYGEFVAEREDSIRYRAG